MRGDIALADTYHALGLHMHQPPGNLKLLIEHEDWEARQIMLAYQRPLKYLKKFPEVARAHIGFSGVLLEQFLDGDIVMKYKSVVDIPAMLRDYANAPNMEIIGMGYYHPIFPLIPSDDWDEQLARNKDITMKVFGREPKGFWPPEMAFTMELIPYLKRAGYEYVLVDSVHVKPLGRPGDQCAPYKPYLAEHDGDQIAIVPRDRDISNAQESGLEPAWFEDQVEHKVADCPSPRLITTWSDGENGGWFRQTHEPSGFWGYYFAPYMDRVRNGQTQVRPVLLSEYIRQNPPTERATVRTGAWNVGSTSGYDFSQWAGSETQRKAIDEIFRVSREYHELRAGLGDKPPTTPGASGAAAPQVADTKGARSSRSAIASPDETAARLLDDAYRYVLQAETSCYLFWGDAWVNRIYEVTWHAWELLGKARQFV